MTPVVDDNGLTLYHGDVLDGLRAIGCDTVDAVVTSPMYLDARPDVGAMTFEAYMDWAEEWLFLLSCVVRSSGTMMLNLGRVHRDGVEVRWHDEVLDRAALSGWRLLDTIVWHKVNGGGGKRTPYLIDRHEMVYWLALDPTGCFKGFDEARVPYSEATVGRYSRKWKSGGSVVKGIEGTASEGRTLNPLGAKAGSVFTSSAGATKGIEHPTPMDIDLATHLIKLSCPPGGVVLDPFLGSGTTAVAAAGLGRRTVGVELDDRWVREAAGRMSQQVLV